MRSQIGYCSSYLARYFCKEICPNTEWIISVDTIPQDPNEHLSELLTQKTFPRVNCPSHFILNKIKILRFFIDIAKKEIKMIQQQVITSIHPKPSPYKEELRLLNITAGAVAQYVGLSYPYILNMLNGAHPMTERTEAKIRELIQQVRRR